MNSTELAGLLAPCFAIAALLGVRHQHLSTLMRAKVAEIKTSKYVHGELRALALNSMLQIIKFRRRNKLIRWAMAASSTAGFFFLIAVVPPIPSYTFTSSAPLLLGSVSLFVALVLVCAEFIVSQQTLDLEIVSAEQKFPNFGHPLGQNRRKQLGSELGKLEGAIFEQKLTE